MWKVSQYVNLEKVAKGKSRNSLIYRSILLHTSSKFIFYVSLHILIAILFSFIVCICMFCHFVLLGQRQDKTSLMSYANNKCLFVCVEVLRPSQPNGVMSSGVSLPNHTFTGRALSSKRLTSIVHILSPETDNCPSWISGRERMTLENISWSISTKECCRPWWGSNPRPSGLQSDAHPTEPPRPANNKCVNRTKCKYNLISAFIVCWFDSIIPLIL